MDNFTNETIDTTRLPRFETVTFTKLHPSYWIIVLIQIAIVFVMVNIAYGLMIFNAEELAAVQLPVGLGIFAVFLLIVWCSRIAFNKKGFAFREHDVLFRHGIIATNTLVIPYNRIQHVALHEGIFSRVYGLAKIAIFTAGGSASDIEVPGIEKEQAENIKQLLMGKIQKEL